MLSKLLKQGLRLLAGTALFGALAGIAATERYDYDALGRLTHYVTPSGRAFEYQYDAVGNLLRVIDGTAAQPTISQIAPASIRQGYTQAVTVTGTGLAGARVVFSDAGFVVSAVVVTATKITFTLSVSATMPVGSYVMTIANAAGGVDAAYAVVLVPPALSVSPVPIAVPPDGLPHQLALRLSYADAVDNTVTLASANPAVFTVAPSSVTIPAGQTSVPISVTGLAAGQAALRLSATALDPVSVPVFVTADFVGLNTSYTMRVGVYKPKPAATTTASISPLTAPIVGLAFSNSLAGLEPASLGTGTGPTTLTLRGSGLQSATAVTVVPADGLTVGSVTAAADGRSLTVPITVAPDAPMSLRQVIVTGASGRYVPTTPQSDRLLITTAAPDVTSVDPIYATVGTPVLNLAVRGRNLRKASLVSIEPAGDIAISAPPVVNSDGTAVSVQLAISPAAALAACRT